MKRHVCFGMLSLFLAASLSLAQSSLELRFCLRSEPKTFNPMLVSDDSSETVRFLTGGVLIRLNRQTQQLVPELALSWKVQEAGRKIVFNLREGVTFSDGTAFSAEDVVFTISKLMDPQLQSPTADSFRSGIGSVTAQVVGPNRVAVTFPAPVAGLDRLFDQVAVVSARSPQKEMAVLGPFMVAEHKPGVHLLLRRNPYYWKRDSQQRRLPYLDSIRLEVQQNRETELLRFQRGQLHMINNVDPTLFDRLAAESPGWVRDAGPSLESEQMWFNQVAAAPIPAYKKVWFRSRNFRRAISGAISRNDICRVVYHGRAVPAAGLLSPANHFWFRQGLKPHPLDLPASLRQLREDGFQFRQGVLRDRDGHPVEFSIITNAGNKTRERMAALIQEDLKQIGIRLNIVTLDFPSLIERISRTFNYEACLLGLVNADLDPNAQMNVWLSSASNHQWNPSQKAPETAWETEVDRLMRAQASTLDAKKRKSYFDRVQEIIWEEAPFIYLVAKNSLAAVSPSLRNISVSVLRPQVYWNVEWLYLGSEVAAQR